MRITEEMRTWAEVYPWKNDHDAAEVRALADRIDAAHERALSEQFKSLTIDMQLMTDENMAEHGWVKLPKDADGVPIKVGDVITHVPDGIKELAPETVKRIVLSKDEQRIVTEDCSYSMPKFLRHYHEPTVEDVLWEFTRDWCESACAGDMTNVERDAARANVIAKYAERIREAMGE